jgi:hypothetical protein
MWEFVVVIVIGAVTNATITNSSGGILAKEKREPGIIWKMF